MSAQTLTQRISAACKHHGLKMWGEFKPGGLLVVGVYSVDPATHEETIIVPLNVPLVTAGMLEAYLRHPVRSGGAAL